MLDCVYRLVAPRSFEPVYIDRTFGLGDCIVRPTHLSICNADMRYYQGKRSPEALAQKLPMALIHEGIGTVVHDCSGTYDAGQCVVMIPNSPNETDGYIAENYLRTSDFCGSGYDGFLQEFVVLPADRTVALPEGLDKNVAAFTEMLSVAVHAVSRFDQMAHGRRDRVGVWGDGNLGYYVALVLRTYFPEMHITVIGRNRFKLNDFTFVDATMLTSEVDEAFFVDHAFECCGGDGSASAIDQIIDCIEPEGAVSLLGVSENPPPINTRMVLEKGLRLFGSSRSGRDDFLKTVDLYRQHPEITQYLGALVGDVVEVDSIPQIVKAFEADAKKTMGKTIMHWNV